MSNSYQLRSTGSVPAPPPNSPEKPQTSRPVMLTVGNVAGPQQFPYFNGTPEMLSSWILDCMDLGAAFDFDEKRIVAAMISVLDGEAKLWWRAEGSTISNVKDSVKNLQVALEKEFGRKANPTEVRKMLQKLHSGDDLKSIKGFLFAFEATCKENGTTGITDAELVELVLQGIHHYDVRAMALLAKPKKFADAKAAILEAVTHFSTLESFSKLSTTNVESSSPSSSIHPGQGTIAATSESDINERLSHMERRFAGFMKSIGKEDRGHRGNQSDTRRYHDSRTSSTSPSSHTGNPGRYCFKCRCAGAPTAPVA